MDCVNLNIPVTALGLILADCPVAERYSFEAPLSQFFLPPFAPPRRLCYSASAGPSRQPPLTDLPPGPADCLLFCEVSDPFETATPAAH